MASKLTAGDLQIIARIAVFRGLKAETVEHIVAPATATMLRPHEWIARQEDPATAFFIVIDGWVKLYRSTPSGDETVIDIMTKGQSFAEAVAFTGNRYIATAEAVSEARVARIPADHIVRCIRENPDIALAMIASISQHMHHLVQQVEQLKAQSGVQRVAEFLASLSLAEQGHCAVALPYDKVLIAGRLGLDAGVVVACLCEVAQHRRHGRSIARRGQRCRQIACARRRRPQRRARHAARSKLTATGAPMQILHPPDWLPPIGYANGISVPAGRIVFIAGQVGWNAEQRFQSEELVPQFEQALKNILAILAQAGGAPNHICRLTAFCIDKPAYLAGRRELGRIWKSLMGNHFPAMSMIFVADLLDTPAKIELEATAVIPA